MYIISQPTNINTIEIFIQSMRFLDIPLQYSDDFVSLQILLPKDFFAPGFSILMYSSSEYFKHYPRHYIALNKLNSNFTPTDS